MEKKSRAFNHSPTQLRKLLWIALILVGFVLLLSSYYQRSLYALQKNPAPLELGDVTNITPQDIPHNRYVKIHGITEHRAIKQALRRLPSIYQATPYWFFRLLGSRGVWIETPTDANRFNTTTELTVEGRAVDPTEEPIYQQILQAYGRFYPQQPLPDTCRIIEVDVLPSDGRYLLLTLWAALAFWLTLFLYQGSKIILLWLLPPAEQK